MAIETIRESLIASRVIGHEKIVELVEGDIIVPDIKPDILSLIKVDGNVYLTRKELYEGKIHVEGNVDVYAIYVSDSGDSMIRGINAVLNFSENIEVPKCKEGMLPVIKYDLKEIEGRIVNGRKISVTCPVDFDIRVVENANVDIIRDVVENPDIQLLKKELRANYLVGKGEQRVSIKENVSLTSENAPIGEILKADIRIVDRDFKISYNKILAKADAKVKIMYVSDDDEASIETFETRLPVMGFIDLDRVNDTMVSEIDYDVLSFYVKPSYQESKANSIYVDLELEMKARTYEEKKVEIIQDLYNPVSPIRYDLIDININQCLINKQEMIEINQSLNVPELNNSRVLDVTSSLKVSDKKVLEDKIIIEGEALLDVLYSRNNKRSVENKKLHVPFQQVINVKGITPVMDDNLYIEVVNTDYKMQSTGQFEFRVFAQARVQAVDNLQINKIDNIQPSEEVETNMDSITIYYTKPKDTLWSIAKKYRTTVDALVKLNELEPDKLRDGKQLIIPKKSYKAVVNPLV
jgi:LysM repeat protein